MDERRCEKRVDQDHGGNQIHEGDDTPGSRCDGTVLRALWNMARRIAGGGKRRGRPEFGAWLV